MKKTNSAASALAPVFQAVEKLTKPQRIGIYAGTLIVLILLSFWLMFWPNYKHISGLENQLAAAQTRLEKAKKNARELNDWRNRMKEKEVQYTKVMRALPEKGEIPSLLAGISQAGKDAGLDFLLFKPAKESKKDFYVEIPVDIEVGGTYHQVAVFFDKVANLPRIVNIRNVSIVPKKDKSGAMALATKCQAVTYKFVEASGNKKRSRRGGKK